MAITLVQQSGQTGGGSDNIHTLNGVAAGNTLILNFSCAVPSLADVVISDNQGNTWLIANWIENANHQIVGIAYATNVVGGNTTVTLHNTLAQNNTGGLSEWNSGVAGQSLGIDQIASASGTGTSLSSGNVSTTSANELLFGVLSISTGTLTVGSGFTGTATIGNSNGEYQIVSSTGSYAATATVSTSANWSAVLVTFLVSPLPIFNTPAGRFNSAGKLVGGLLVPIWTGVNVTPVTVNANSTSDQNLMSITVPAFTLNSVGRTLKFAAKGLYSTPSGSSATITIKVQLGSLTVINITTGANPGSVTNNSFLIEGQITTQTAGSSAALEASGRLEIDLGAAPSSAATVFNDTNTATIGTIDLTQNETLQITIAFSAGSASNSATQRQLVLQTIS